MATMLPAGETQILGNRAMLYDNSPLVRVEDLKMHFPFYRGILSRQVGAVKAVDGISFNIQQGETLGLVSATLGVANAIITESALSFLGLGFPSDFPTWGVCYLMVQTT